jgi:hypothetical protein
MGSPVPVDEEFLRRAQYGRAPEKRFRFADRCMQSECVFWANERCDVAATAVSYDAATHYAHGTAEARLPRCGIRPNCRWFAQEGAAACGVCPFVITDVSEAMVDAST